MAEAGGRVPPGDPVLLQTDDVLHVGGRQPLPAAVGGVDVPADRVAGVVRHELGDPPPAGPALRLDVDPGRTAGIGNLLEDLINEANG